jgi:hypothetical protein
MIGWGDGMKSPGVDTPPIKSLILWLADEAGSIPPPEKPGMERSVSEINDLKHRIATGEYKLDASAIAEAMFSRVGSTFAVPRRSDVLEAGQSDRPAGGVDHL